MKEASSDELSELTLDDLRPREWSVDWSYKTGNGSWYSGGRVWDDEDKALAHVRALQALADATPDEIRAPHLAVRMTKLDAGDWEEVAGWGPNG